MVDLLKTHIECCIGTDMESIKFEHTEMGSMVQLRNRFPKDRVIRDWTGYFITLHQATIEDLTERVQNERRESAEITGV